MLKPLRFSILFLLLAGCVVHREPTLRHLIPAPPDKPRIEWLGTYADESDFPNFSEKKRLAYLTGMPVKTPLQAPSGIVSDGEGKVFVGDLHYKNVLVFDLKAMTLQPLSAVGDIEPRQMTLDSKQRLYIADGKQRMVRVFSRDGDQIRTFGSPKELLKPLGVAIDEKRQRIYISDGAANQVKAFDLENGNLILTIGTGFTSKQEGDLHNPAGLALAHDGDLYVVEHLGARISVFHPDGSFHKFIGSRNSSQAGLENPRSVSIDSEGNLWVVDFRRKALRAFDREGNLLFLLEGPAEDKLGFYAPAAIYIDANDEIYVADIIAARFSHWRYLSKKALERHPVSAEDLDLVIKALAPKEEEDVSPALPPATPGLSK